MLQNIKSISYKFLFRVYRRLLRIINLFVYPRFGLHTGYNVKIRSRVFFDKPSSVYIGDGSFINRGCEFHIGGSDTARIRIGAKCFLGMNVSLICVNHEIGTSTKRAADNIYQDIIIGDGCWIGANSTILPGVVIGDGSIVAAGSLVCKNVIPNTLSGGGTSKAY